MTLVMKLFEPGDMYAVVAGDYSGKYIVPMEQDEDLVECLTLPDQSIIQVPVEDYSEGIEKELLDKVAVIEPGVYTYLHGIYTNEKNHN